jgi:hypothetical protein
VIVCTLVNKCSLYTLQSIATVRLYTTWGRRYYTFVHLLTNKKPTPLAGGRSTAESNRSLKAIGDQFIN